jgi:hypothetical protein
MTKATTARLSFSSRSRSALAIILSRPNAACIPCPRPCSQPATPWTRRSTPPSAKAAHAFGGGFLNEEGTEAIVNNEAGVKALKFYTDLLNEHQVAQPSAVGNAHGDVRQLFMTGQVAMFIDGPWARGTLTEMAPNINWSVCQIPAADGMEPRFTTTS